jgi:hypothetical protein
MLEGHLQALLAGLFLACALNFLVASVYGPRWLRWILISGSVITLGWCGFYVAATINTFNGYNWFASLADTARTLQFFNVAGFFAIGILIGWPFWRRLFLGRVSVEGERCGHANPP